MQHHLLNMSFEVEGDHATGVGYLWFVAVSHRNGPGEPYAMGGPYTWDYIRSTNGGWLLTRQRLGVSWHSGQDATSAFDQGVSDGSRDRLGFWSFRSAWGGVTCRTRNGPG
ncbi:nuclear transport factor 2 family protein [Streptomyces inhibens]|uniref:nuclear transport factor 2 family protein n=1 Tax=Streptomyces inhibens TaxID=2293571 RepID=UPI001EE6F8F3|nr:nuclear transport factor 2 family protein [Streptomyces inhibens]